MAPFRSLGAMTSSSKNLTDSDKVHNSKRAPEPVGAYPHARRAGDFLFLSGVGPRQPGSSEIPGVHKDALGRVISYDVAVQTEAVIQNIRAILEDAGARFDQIVDVQAFLTNMKKDFTAYNQVYAKHFGEIQATRTTVEIGALPTPIAVEFKVIAYLGRT